LLLALLGQHANSLNGWTVCLLQRLRCVYRLKYGYCPIILLVRTVRYFILIQFADGVYGTIFSGCFFSQKNISYAPLAIMMPILRIAGDGRILIPKGSSFFSII
jgi:hypothetical protein